MRGLWAFSPFLISYLKPIKSSMPSAIGWMPRGLRAVSVAHRSSRKLLRYPSDNNRGALRHRFVMLGIFTIVAIAPARLWAQTTPKKPNDYSGEAFVIQQFTRTVTFENDGTSIQDDREKIRIQSDAGVKRFGLLSLSYASGTGSFELVYVRARKPDGTVIETPPENMQDMAAQITREAPFYSDLHEKHVAVKGLGVGDTLEVETRIRTTKPLAPGQFWAEYRFTTNEIVLDEEYQVRVPRDRAVRLKSAKVQPAIHDEGAYRVYSWKHYNLTNEHAVDEKREQTERLWQRARGRLPQNDVLLSSYGSWEAVGQWYEGLQEDRVKPTPEIAAKAAELTKGAADDDAKIRAIYAYVSTQFRYIGVAFGIGRYQPHSAAEVLGNQYGDCKDKHTLLASLLAASGIAAYPALISVEHEVDESVPSPGQFDHVVTVVPRGEKLVWLDTTSEVGPYQFLAGPLRNKHALMMGKDKAVLIETPADLPYASTQSFHMDAKVNDEGTLEGQAEFTTRGDFEVVLRSAFRSVALTDWKDLVQRISMSAGFGGEVSEVTASSPEKTDEPFHFSYKYTRKEFGDWANRRILAPSPLILLPAPSDEELLPKGPSYLGPGAEIRFTSVVEIPKGYRAELPQAVHLSNDFAEYDSTYQLKDGKIVSERRLRTLLREVPEKERKDYKDFAKAIQDDYGVYIPLHSGTDSAASNPVTSFVDTLRNLPDSTNPDATRLEKEARDQLQSKRNPQEAVSALYRAVAADPKFTRAWVVLGSLLLGQRQIDAGKEAFEKAMASDPGQRAIPKAFGMGLMASQEFDDAVPVWQKVMKNFPDDKDAAANLGRCLEQLKRYSEAAATYEQATKVLGERTDLQTSLAAAYARAGEREKAEAAYKKLAEMHPNSSVLNAAAYDMANAGISSSLSVDYAKQAVQEANLESRTVQLVDLTMEDLRVTQKLAAYWDTLGWAYAKQNKLQDAEEYLQPAWKMTQDGTVGAHLCEVYDRLHRKEQAIRMCKMGLERLPMTMGLTIDEAGTIMSETRERLDHLDGTATTLKGRSDASDLVIRERTFKLPRFLMGTESAEFYVLLVSDGKNKSFRPEDVKFISGSPKMKFQGKRLKAINFEISAPAGVEAKFVRRGILGCYQYTGCSFVLLDPGAVQSVN